MEYTDAVKKKILILAERPETCGLLSRYLQKEGYDTAEVSGVFDVFRLIPALGPQLLLIDTAITGVDSNELYRKLRSICRTPMIILSDKADVIDKVLALELGADDYLTKPYDLRELLARIKAVLRRSYPVGALSETTDVAILNSASSDLDDVSKVTGSQTSSFVTRELSTSSVRIIQYTGLVINLTNYSVTYLGKQVDMPPRELELLYFLASSPNQVFTRSQLLDHVWGYEYVGDTRTVDVHIKRIRSKIKNYGGWSISTIWGVGYKFQVR